MAVSPGRDKEANLMIRGIITTDAKPHSASAIARFAFPSRRACLNPGAELIPGRSTEAAACQGRRAAHEQAPLAG